jgi:hypothetical protein
MVLILGWCGDAKSQPPNHAIKQHRGMLVAVKTLKPKPLRIQLTLKENGKDRIFKISRWTLAYDSKEKNPSLKIPDVVDDSNRYRSHLQLVGEQAEARLEQMRQRAALKGAIQQSQESFTEEEQRQERYGSRLKLHQLRKGQEVMIFSYDEKNDPLLILLLSQPAKPTPLETEAVASAKFRLIEQLINAGQKETAKIRLEEFVKTYGDTASGAKAKKMLESLP